MYSVVGLELMLKLVFKMFGMIKYEWCFEVFVVGFKFEIDVDLFVDKVCKFFECYCLDVVVVNEFMICYDYVIVFVVDGLFKKFECDSNSRSSILGFGYGVASFDG